MGFVALLPPADLQLFWKLSSPHGLLTSDVLTYPSRSGQTLATDDLLIRGPGHSFPRLETRGFCWRKSGLPEKTEDGMETKSLHV